MGKTQLTDVTFCQLCELVIQIWEGTDGLSWTTRTAVMTAFFARRDMVERLDAIYKGEESKRSLYLPHDVP